MKKEKYDWLECSLFLMIANSEITDYYLTEEEITAIISKAKDLASQFKNDQELFTGEDITQKFNTAFEWYTSLGDTAAEGELNTTILQEISRVARYLKKQKLFTVEVAQALLETLIEVAKVDGELIRNEKSIINTIAKQWRLPKPFED